MRKFILITAMVLVSATAHAGSQRSLTLASSDEPAKSVETKPSEARPVEVKPAEATPAEAPKYVDRPSVVDTKAASAPCPPRSDDRRSAQDGAKGHRHRPRSRSTGINRPKAA